MEERVCRKFGLVG